MSFPPHTRNLVCFEFETHGAPRKISHPSTSRKSDCEPPFNRATNASKNFGRKKHSGMLEHFSYVFQAPKNQSTSTSNLLIRGFCRGMRLIFLQQRIERCTTSQSIRAAQHSVKVVYEAAVLRILRTSPKKDKHLLNILQEFAK